MGGLLFIEERFSWIEVAAHVMVSKPITPPGSRVRCGIGSSFLYRPASWGGVGRRLGVHLIF